MQITNDYLMNKQIILKQPMDGYRVAIDPVFLAAAVTAQPNDSILDVGCGVGAAMLCLAKRVNHVVVTGLELQPAYAALAQDNIMANNLQDHTKVICGDLATPWAQLPVTAGSFNHVMTNPPYLAKHKFTPPVHQDRSLAHIESHVCLQQWLTFCLHMLRSKGILTMIYPTDRLDEVLSILRPQASAISIYPLRPMDHKPAKRLIIRACKNSPSAIKIYAGMTLHTAQGLYTSAANDVLRNFASINF